jgi:hypothetical protein
MRTRKNLKKKETKFDKFRKILGILFIAFFSLFFLKIGIGNYLLKGSGICTKAILTDQITGVRGHKDTLVYKFWINGKAYDGNSNVEDLSKAGSNICVVYLELMPSVNRPLSFYDESINCNCR